MAKEFDIYLNKQLTECDIIVYSIPYRDKFTATHRLILESCIESYKLQKFIAIQTGSELVQHIDEMLAFCNERLYNETQINASAEFQVQYALCSGNMGIGMSSKCLNTLAQKFINVESAMQLIASPVMVYTNKPGDNWESTVEIGSIVQKDVKNSILTLNPSTEINALILAIKKTSAIKTDASIPIITDLTNLCYRFYSGVQTILQVSAEVLSTELHYSFGNANTSVDLLANIGDGYYLTKCNGFSNAISLLSDITTTIQKFIDFKNHLFTLECTIELVLKQYRTLGDMDHNSLLDYANMTLEEINYVIT